MLKPENIPMLLVGLRFAIAPLLLLDAFDHHTGIAFVVGYVIAVLSDIFDGIIARRLGVSTERLRIADSWADISLYVCIAFSVWLVFPQTLSTFQMPLLVAVAAQLSLFAINLIKFQKLPSLHTYTAKIWGLTLLVATVGLFGFGNDQLVWLAIALCLINSVEEILMTLILPEWQCDVLSLAAAIQIRQTWRSP
ncbi:CDP-alcohol phosphatidyltransferase family protein [Leptolyngbya iicbica]|uniref:CDP-alcohol phosphatidyltransferase family protein n=2 Tax=Cyanophyceae TaxID=3028117 RepID=A0A4V2E2K0_9CYAN|nr:CDP-alcohol phosphatidyltransferase family protein [Leptolyngbya sp. LK]RZM78826.1 CDP-alcohol phosphatidyltransferase family protein [Leptolyngbya sp. LK]